MTKRLDKASKNGSGLQLVSFCVKQSTTLVFEVGVSWDSNLLVDTVRDQNESWVSCTES